MRIAATETARTCPRCSTAVDLLEEPEMNDLTGKQLKRDGEPVTRLRCPSCGYSVRPKPKRRRKT